jgi:ubiquinone/menaquinone biosynthesis C-methylase UbiE
MTEMKSEPKAKWETYYSNYRKKTFVVSLIEWANKNYFTPMFMNELYKVMRKRKGLTILEPGCGSGLMSSYLAKDNKITVLDMSKNALYTAKNNFDNNNVKGEFILGNLLNIPFTSGLFDVVWNQGVIEHFKDPSHAMREMMRVAKKGGYVVIFIPAFLSPLHLVYLFLRLCRLKKLWPFDDVEDVLRPKTFKMFMEKAGYKNIKIKRLWIKSIGFSQIGYCQKTD